MSHKLWSSGRTSNLLTAGPSPAPWRLFGWLLYAKPYSFQLLLCLADGPPIWSIMPTGSRLLGAAWVLHRNVISLLALSQMNRKIEEEEREGRMRSRVERDLDEWQCHYDFRRTGSSLIIVVIKSTNSAELKCKKIKSLFLNFNNILAVKFSLYLPPL